MSEFRAIQSPTLNFKSASSSSQNVGSSLQTTPRKHCTNMSLGSYSPRNTFVFYLFLGPDKLFTRSQWFPDAYYGQGQRGHRYHVFDEVRPPERDDHPSVVLMTSSLCITEFPNKQIVLVIVQDYTYELLHSWFKDNVRGRHLNPSKICTQWLFASALKARKRFRVSFLY